MPSSQTPVLAAIGAVALGVSLAATGGSAQAISSAPVLMAASYAAGPAEPADPTPVDPVTGGLVTGVLGNTVNGNIIGDTLKVVDVASPLQLVGELLESGPFAVVDGLDLATLTDQLLELNPVPQTVDQVVSVLLP